MVLEVKKLTVASSEKKIIFKKCSFSLMIGENLALMGESGSGKTTMMKAIVGLLPKKELMITEGEIWWKGILTSDPAFLRGQEIVYVSQNVANSLNPLWSVKKHFSLISKTDEHRKYLDEVNLSQHIMNSYPHQLSGGMCQRLLLALALSISPSLLILDEPTSALDLKNSDQLLSLLQSFRLKYQMSLILVTHNKNFARKICDREYILKAIEFSCKENKIC